MVEGPAHSDHSLLVRLRRGVFNPYSIVGLMATSRVSDGRYNVALGADGLFRVRGDEYVTLKWAGTRDDQDPDGDDAGTRSLFNLRWQRRTQRGLSYNFEGLRVRTIEGRELGTVSHLFATGANDVLVVKGERERLIPFVRDGVVREIDLAAGAIVVDWDPEF